VEVRIDLPRDERVAYAMAEEADKYRLCATSESKTVVVERLVAEHAGEQLLVIGQYIDQLDEIGERLQAPVIKGDTSVKERQKLFDAFRAGEVQTLPFPDHTFDLTTCQTVLIHVPDPAAALAEMIRVTKPGGLVAVAEPNNVAGALHVDSVSAKASIDDLIELARFHLTCERGKANLGLGNNSVGDLMPGMFAASGLEGVDVYLNDKVATLFPPYATEAQRALVEEARTHQARDFWVWSKDETRSYFFAGGGDEAAFVTHWQRAMASREARAAALRAGSYASADGSVCYLVSGRKPLAP